MNIIGLGSFGCDVAKRISLHNSRVYNTYLLDTKKYKDFKSRKIEQQDTPELYEQNHKSLKRFLVNLSDNTLLVLSGEDLVTSCCLRVLEEIREKTEIRVLYIMPDPEMLPKTKRLHERMIRGVLQQYARSGLLERMYIVSLNNISEIIGPMTLSARVDGMKDTISYYFHMLNYYDNSSPVMESSSTIIAPAKISTVGVFDMETKEEKMFFNLDFPREIMYYYGISREVLETDVDLYKSIKDHIKNSDFESVSYKIFQLTSNSNCGIVVKHASYIQE